MSNRSSTMRPTTAPIFSSQPRPIHQGTRAPAWRLTEVDAQQTSRSLAGPLRGFLRLSAIIAPHGPIPVARSTWWAGVRSGRYPPPVKLGPRVIAWRIEDIEALIERPGQAFSPGCRMRTRRPDHA